MSHALTVLGWFEMSDEDRPPEEIWLDSEKLNAHFEGVRERYESQTAGGERVEEPEGGMMENELMRGVR